VAANALSATFTLLNHLLPNTYYSFCFDANYYTNCAVVSGYTDVAGNLGSGGATAFTTGTSSFTTSPTVVKYQSAQQYNNNRSAKCVYSRLSSAHRWIR